MSKRASKERSAKAGACGTEDKANKIWIELDDVDGEERLAIEDLSWCLARICRYGGRLPRCGPIAFYSVADHSVLVALILREWGADALVQFHGLMHDAHEAIIGDITTPVKRWLGIEALEMEMARAVAANFGLWSDPEIDAAIGSLVKTADIVALAVEVRALGLPMHLYFPDERQRDRYLAMAPDLHRVIQREGLLTPNLTMFVGEQIEQSAKRFERWFDLVCQKRNEASARQSPLGVEKLARLAH